MLEHLHKTIETCIDYHVNKGNTVKVSQLSERLNQAGETTLDSSSKNTPLYND